jgi:7,8-dihydropterin-6-yl-methyl-4-(beta-D-ribofuranosyl)aminobenzene 5'-phosphate synthase
MLFWLRHRRARAAIEAELRSRGARHVELSGSVPSLTIRFLVDYYPASARFHGEAGVSYLLEGGGHAVLFDLGWNARRERPSPLAANLAALGVDPPPTEGIFLSHNHLDHVGGAREQRRRVPDTGQLPAELIAGTLWSPVALEATALPCRVLEDPEEILPGWLSTGALPAHLYFLGLLREQALLVDVAGRGLTLVSGCGHPGIVEMVRLARALTGRPVTDVVGGLHLVVSHGRTAAQKVIAASQPPWALLDEEGARRIGEGLRREGVLSIAPSAHDSCDRALEILRAIFAEGYHEVRAGEALTIAATAPDQREEAHA